MMQRRSILLIVLAGIIIAGSSFAATYLVQMQNRPDQPKVVDSPTIEPKTGVESTSENSAPQSAPVQQPISETDPPTEAPVLVEELSCQKDVCVLDPIFLAYRPIEEDRRSTINPVNRFGEYQRSRQDSNHGVYFLNSTGTAVQAVADGVVVVSGNDNEISYSYRTNVLGRLIILKHDLPGLEKPIFTLYGHLSGLGVDVGDEVKAGDKIGEVGSTGSIRGSTLYFEVRWSQNSYDKVRNPELWLPPIDTNDEPAYGILAGRVVDNHGRPVQVENIVIERIDPDAEKIKRYYIQTYGNQKLAGQKPYGEYFALSDLPPGEYQLSIWMDGMIQRQVEINPAKITYVVIEVLD